jgi:hypothetical protein
MGIVNRKIDIVLGWNYLETRYFTFGDVIYEDVRRRNILRLYIHIWNLIFITIKRCINGVVVRLYLCTLLVKISESSYLQKVL